MEKTKAKEIIEVLSRNFTDKPALTFSTPYELLIAVILSAQCTDERVNKVTKELFKSYNTPEKMVKLSPKELGEIIKPCGLYKTKAEHIISASEKIISDYNGKVPENLEDLRTLPGVGRKTANVVGSVAFSINAIAVDTHVFRVSNRIGLSKSKDVLKTELDLQNIIEENSWRRAHHYLIYLGRSFCKARKPDCANCPINSLCEKNISER